MTPTDAHAAATTDKPFDRYYALQTFVTHASTADRSALARLDPDAPMPHQLAALARALLAAKLEPERWQRETWRRWALIAHGIALAGHENGQLGAQLAEAGVSEARVTRLLTARGDAFTQALPRLLRLLASKSVKPNWKELGALILNESAADTARQQIAESARLRIAGAFFSSLARKATSH